MKKDPMLRLRELTETYDLPLWQAGTLFAGVDEAGRGPLCGNVTVGCIIMPREPLIPYVDDSKKLTEKRREELYARITETALYWGIGEASPEEIDRLNILEATKLAMRRAAREIPAELFLVDAVKNAGLPGREMPIVHGDALSYSIAAASILAKVTRDREMAELDLKYPGYGFAVHKGYGTAKHIAALKALGPCPAHRRSFITHFIHPGDEGKP